MMRSKERLAYFIIGFFVPILVLFLRYHHFFKFEQVWTIDYGTEYTLECRKTPHVEKIKEVMLLQTKKI